MWRSARASAPCVPSSRAGWARRGGTPTPPHEQPGRDACRAVLRRSVRHEIRAGLSTEPRRRCACAEHGRLCPRVGQALARRAVGRHGHCQRPRDSVPIRDHRGRSHHARGVLQRRAGDQVDRRSVRERHALPGFRPVRIAHRGDLLERTARGAICARVPAPVPVSGAAGDGDRCCERRCPIHRWRLDHTDREQQGRKGMALHRPTDGR